MESKTWRKKEKTPGFSVGGGPSRQGFLSRMYELEIQTVLPRAMQAKTHRTLN